MICCHFEVLKFKNHFTNHPNFEEGEKNEKIWVLVFFFKSSDSPESLYKTDSPYLSKPMNAMQMIPFVKQQVALPGSKVIVMSQRLPTVSQPGYGPDIAGKHQSRTRGEEGRALWEMQHPSLRPQSWTSSLARVANRCTFPLRWGPVGRLGTEEQMQV